MTRIALALGGGGARGVAHLHVVEALEEEGLSPEIIAGSSIGAIIGAGVAAGLRARDMREQLFQGLGSRRRAAAGLWRQRPSTLAAMAESMRHWGRLDTRKVLAAFLPPGLPSRIEDLSIPLRVTATDFYDASTVVIAEGDLVSALAASAAIPVMFKPELVNGRWCIDGGLSCPVPFDLVCGAGRCVLAVDVVGTPQGRPDAMPGGLATAYGAAQAAMKAIVAARVALHAPDILLSPSVGAWRVLDFHKMHEIDEATRPLKDETRRRLAQALERRRAG